MTSFLIPSAILTLLIAALGKVALHERGFDDPLGSAGILAASLIGGVALTGLYRLTQRHVPTPVLAGAGLFVLLIAAFTLAGLDVVTSATGVTIVLGVFAAAYFLIERGNERRDFRRSLNRLTEQMESERAQILKTRMEQRALDDRSGLLDRLTDWFQKLFSFENKAFVAARKRLMAAGYGNDASLALYMFIRVAGPAAGLIAAAPVALAYDDDPVVQVTILMFAVVLVYYLIETFVTRRVDARKNGTIDQFPDVIDLLVIYTEAGKSLEGALTEVATSSERRYPLMATEIRRLLRELQLLNSRNVAYDNFATRLSTDIVRRFVTVVKQAEAVGAPVSDTLRILAADSRRDRVQLAERRAARVPVLIQIPIILFILPALFVIILAPVAIEIMKKLGGLL